MELVTTIEELTRVLREHRRATASIGLVPTMGALHAGHRSLIDRARADDDVVAVSIFVNPWQFNDASDFTHYPRSLDADLVVADGSGVDVVFAPALSEMYPGGEPLVRVDPGVLGSRLEGASRPGHFVGVATVVAKLFAIFSADRAYFGEKDYEQLALVRRLVLDLSFPVEVVACPTVREVDGLALSSRNARLTPAQRAAAPVLYRSLVAGRSLLESGVPPEVASAEMQAVISGEPSAVVAYAEVRDAATLEPPGGASRALRLLVAATFGDIRLIDNLGVEVLAGRATESVAQRLDLALREVDASEGLEPHAMLERDDVHPPIQAIRPIVTLALEEDLLPLGDLTSMLLDPGKLGAAKFVARRPGVVAGTRAVVEVCRQVDARLECTISLDDGCPVAEGGVIARIRGPFGAILSAERTALNFLSHLSGVATLTDRYVSRAAEGAAGARVWDTRKTTPGLRSLEKAAVRAGGGFNHRGNLSEAILIKDNHLGGISIADAVARAKHRWPGRMVEVECDRLEQVHEAVAAGATLVLCDNMTPAEVEQAAAIAAGAQEATGRCLIEASGGVTLETVAAYAAAGADLISVGALTHSAPILDIGLDLE